MEQILREQYSAAEIWISIRNLQRTRTSNLRCAHSGHHRRNSQTGQRNFGYRRALFCNVINRHTIWVRFAGKLYRSDPARRVMTESGLSQITPVVGYLWPHNSCLRCNVGKCYCDYVYIYTFFLDYFLKSFSFYVSVAVFVQTILVRFLYCPSRSSSLCL